MAGLYVGTSGWSDPEWRDGFYAGGARDRRLEHDAECFGARWWAGAMAEPRRSGALDPAANAPCLLCDEMLKGIGRWLRAAGYDTLIARSGTADADLLAFAQAGGRTLLTCDRRLARLPGHRAAVVTLGSEALDAAAAELRRRLGNDWLRAPFSRCLLDNAPLRPASAQELARVPASARRGAATITVCPECARAFWPGSHVRRMRARLERWQAL